MAAITDLLTQATTTSRPVPTTVTGIRAISGTTLSCLALTGWPTATAVHFITYKVTTAGAKVAGSQADWKGIVSGTNITGLVLKAGTDQGNVIGDVVEAAPTAGYANDVSAWGTAQHNQDGTHAAVTATSVTSPGVINASAVSSLQDASIPLSTYRSELGVNNVASGGIWTGDAYGSTLNASMTALVCYINGQRLTFVPISGRTYTATRDTYVDVLNTAGVASIVYTEVANGAASPALAANSIRLAKVVTAANIASASSITQVTNSDSLGNIIYPKGAVPSTKLQNPVKFSVYRSAAWNTSAGPNLIIMDTKTYDTGNNFSTTTGLFTAPVAGFYWFYANFSQAHVNGAGTGANLFKNGTVNIKSGGYMIISVTTAFPLISTVSGYLQLAANDTVSPYCYGNNSAGGTGANLTYFEGSLVSTS